MMERLLDTTDDKDFIVQTDTEFELGFVINKETSDVDKWPTWIEHLYLVKYNPVQLNSDGSPTYNYGSSGAVT